MRNVKLIGYVKIVSCEVINRYLIQIIKVIELQISSPMCLMAIAEINKLIKGAQRPSLKKYLQLYNKKKNIVKVI